MPATARAEPVEVGTLLGSRGLDLSIRCLASLATTAEAPVSLRIHDDGTLTELDIEALRAELPISSVVRRAEADDLAEQNLARWPACLALRRSNVLALKLFDLLWFGDAPEIRYVDSDVLFLRSFRGAPIDVRGEFAVFFPDEQSAYAVGPGALLGAGSPNLPARINSGLFSIPRRRFELEPIERFLADWKGRSPMWIEQTCWALLAGTGETRLLEPRQFRMHDPRAPFSSELVALHFVSSVRDDLPRVLQLHPIEKTMPVVETRLRPVRRLRAVSLVIEGLRRRLHRLRPTSG